MYVINTERLDKIPIKIQGRQRADKAVKYKLPRARIVVKLAKLTKQFYIKNISNLQIHPDI